MKCPECVATGQASTLQIGPTFSTAMYSAPHYDEDGEYHMHDLNTRTTSYSCSNGHSFSQNVDPTCPNRNCEWGKTPEQIAEERKPECCGGGPQWGHAWDCPTLP